MIIQQIIDGKISWLTASDVLQNLIEATDKGDEKAKSVARDLWQVYKDQFVSDLVFFLRHAAEQSRLDEIFGQTALGRACADLQTLVKQQQNQINELALEIVKLQAKGNNSGYPRRSTQTTRTAAN
jgi:hypothetical protein